MSNVIEFPSKNKDEQMIVTLGGGHIQEDDGSYTAIVTFAGLRTLEEAEAVFDKMLDLIREDFEAAGGSKVDDLPEDKPEQKKEYLGPFDEDLDD